MSKKKKKDERLEEKRAEETQSSDDKKIENSMNDSRGSGGEQDCCAELEELKEKYLRAVADFDNMKKRLERDKSSAVSFANETFAKDLLSVIDSFESALATISQIDGNEAVDKIKEGITLTFEQLLKVLKKHGVQEVAHEGVFDPNFHQAIQQVESDEHESGEIVNVLQKGYTLKDRLLRPAIVTTKK